MNAMAADASADAGHATSLGRPCIGDAGCDNRGNGKRRSGNSEKCRTFEHGSQTFWLDVGHPGHWSGDHSTGFKPLIFGKLSFI